MGVLPQLAFHGYFIKISPVQKTLKTYLKGAKSVADIVVLVRPVANATYRFVGQVYHSTSLVCAGE